MTFLELLLIAVSLSMDAFAVAICKGLAMNKIKIRDAVIIGVWFGGFQALMPVVGYLLGIQFQAKITAVDHWIAFILLGLIGANMIREAFSKKGDEKTDASVNFKSMFVLAVATSIDALAIGVTFAFLQVQIIPAVTTIGVTTFILSLVGVKVGNLFGVRYKAKAEFVGGVILILLGLKILLGHLGVISF